MKVSNKFHTHEVVNQPHELLAYNLWLADPLLQSLVKQHHYAPLPALLDNFGHYTGEMQFEHGEKANRNKPVLHAFDRYGRRTDKVEFHPSYHALMGSAMEHQVHSYSWQNSSIPGAHVVRATLLYIHSQADAGTTCPLTMTHAAVPAIQYAKHLPDYWLDKIINGIYDSRELPAVEMRSRLLTEQTALALQACVLLNNEEAEIRTIANSFCESRLAGHHGLAFGTLPASTPCEEIITTGTLLHSN